ncbi:Hypothetical predicted protein [Paramuricea clavata]|uniref:Uncharacterized protein n=1 Tax=Paramuricea clavata TaxID=317549 RepID=A0A7D9IJJ1_PARCT|nr:Hypothetical predicted protein [Paramuricea clavata]
MGAWEHNGSPKKSFLVKRDKHGMVKNVTLLQENESPVENSDVFTLKRIYYVNKSSSDLRKVISTVQDSGGVEPWYTLIQYIFKGKEHQVSSVLPHGNAKTTKPYARLMSSTRNALQASLNGKETVSNALDNVYRSVGDVTHAHSVGQLPRGPQDIYNARCAAKKEAENPTSRGPTAEVRGVWELLEKAKREEKEDVGVPPSFENAEYIRTFLLFWQAIASFENISLTVTTYRNLKLHHGSTKKPPVFIGPILMHKHKDWKTYSRFANTLITECPDLEGIIACGTDGEKVLINGLKRNFRFALFLRCFIHFKDNVKRELQQRGLSSTTKNLFLAEIFGKQEEDVKYTGLVDCGNVEEFDSKLQGLQKKWDEREAAENNSSKRSSTFYEWFLKEKVRQIL